MTINMDGLSHVEIIRSRPAMYVGDILNSTGPHHMVLEVLANSVDQHLAGRCTRVDVTMHADGSLSVSDDGAGISLKVDDHGTSWLESVLTTLHNTPTADGHAKGAAKSPRERADPLTDRDLREDGVDQVRGDVRHTTTQTGRAKAATLAGETHHHLMTASAARELDEAVLRNPASQIRVELILHELRQAALRFGALAESRPVLTHERMQERVLRSPRRVAIAARLLGARRSRRLSHLNLHRRK